IKTNKSSRPARGAARGAGGGGAIRRGRGATARSGPAPYSVAPRLEQTKIMISNLAASVSEDDLKELFKSIGPIKTAFLNFDAQGRSKGAGTVVYRRDGDAAKAVEQYHNRTLDGKPMRIELVVSAQAVTALASSAAAASSSGSAGRGRGTGARRGRGRGAGGASRREPRKPKTAEELDAEMDTYMK
ncbi:hypothetical protein HK405_012519, partial [Cladochytrium tenue]